METKNILFSDSEKNEEKLTLTVSRGASCPSCHTDLTDKELAEHLLVCHHCGHLFRLTPMQRIAITADNGSFSEFHEDLTSVNPIDLSGYEEKLNSSRKKTGFNEAVVTGSATIKGIDVILGVMSFDFMGGSMGSVVGEKITRAILKGADEGLPVTLFTASGGARMQEGIFSLMQMAKTSHAAALLDELDLPLIIVLTNPTTGGVTASFAMLGDVILAEPGALIGFAGPRVIEGTIREQLPEGFQTAEFQQEKGFVDTVVERKKIRNVLGFILKNSR